MRQEVRLGGFGGQGIILAGYILGKAAALYDDKEAVFTQAYGPEARGGACSADLVISDEPIGYPMVSRPDLLVLMSQEAFTKYGSAVAEGAQLIVDTDLVESAAGKEWLRDIPATRLAAELGNRMVANVIMLGYLATTSDDASDLSASQPGTTSVRPALLELNLKAFACGFEYAPVGARS